MPHSESLILVAEDCLVCESQVPHLNIRKKTIERHAYEILTEHPYHFSEEDFFHELHVKRRERPDLKISTYQLKRTLLVKKYGWGIHKNNEGKLALIAMESEEYERLKSSIKTEKSYRTSK